MNNNSPLVSICVPAYNSGRYLRECLDSIVAQTYPNLEIIVGDDGSTDDTAVIAREYADRFGIRFHQNPKNTGAAATSSALVEMARGDYIAVYHADDRYERTIVEESAALLQSDPEIGLVGTMAHVIDERGGYLREFRLHEALRRLNKSAYSFDEVMLGVLKNGGSDIILVTPSVMARRAAYEQLGLFAEQYRDIYDYEMWLRIATRYRVAVLDKKLLSYRIHQNQISQLQTRRNLDVPNIVRVIRDYRGYISDRKVRRQCDSLLDRWVFRAAKRQNRLGRFEKSSATLKLIESRKYLPLRWLLIGMNTLRAALAKRDAQ